MQKVRGCLVVATLAHSPMRLAISNSLQILIFFTWFVRGMADSAAYLNSVEIIRDYAANTDQVRAVCAVSAVHA